MSVIFLKEDVAELLRNKFVVVMGGSIQRSVYKDLVKLIQSGLYLTDKQLRAKGEKSIVRDKLVFKSEATNGICYREVREYLTESHYLYFIFMTRCFNAYVESMLSQLSSSEPKPDVIIINSCLWDLTRYGDNAIPQYKDNLSKLFVKLAELFPDSLAIWVTNPPIATDPKGGVFVPETEHLKCQMELNVIEANFCARELAVEHGHDVLDLHHYLRYQVHRRAEDGIHWDMTGHRRMSNLLLSHIAEAWDITLPHHLHNYYNTVQEEIETVEDHIHSNPIPLDFDEADGSDHKFTPAGSELFVHQQEDWRWPGYYDDYTDHRHITDESESAHQRYYPQYSPIHSQPFTPDYQGTDPHEQYSTVDYPPWSVEAQNQRWGTMEEVLPQAHIRPVPVGSAYRHIIEPHATRHSRPTGWLFRPKLDQPYPLYYESRLVRRYQPY